LRSDTLDRQNLHTAQGNAWKSNSGETDPKLVSRLTAPETDVRTRGLFL